MFTFVALNFSSHQESLTGTTVGRLPAYTTANVGRESSTFVAFNLGSHLEFLTGTTVGRSPAGTNCANVGRESSICTNVTGESLTCANIGHFLSFVALKNLDLSHRWP